MPRPSRRNMVKSTPSTFWTTKENPKGASIGNAIKNIKSTPAAFKEMGKAIKTGTVGKMMYRDMNPMGKGLVDSVAKKIGYVSKETRAGMKRTNAAGKKGQLGAGWGE